MKSLILPLLIFLGSLTAVYFTLEQDKLLQDEQNLRLEKIEESRKVIALSDKKKVELKRAEEALSKTRDDLAVYQDDLGKLKGDETTLRSSISRLEGDLAKFKDQQKKFESSKASVAKLAQELNMSFNIDNIEQQLATMKQTKADRVNRVDELDLLIEASEKSIDENTADLARQAAREDARQMKIKRAAIEAVITGVQQDWGFLVIGAGSNSGFSPTSTLLVKRDGRLIGKVNPSSVEPTQTIAEIIFSSLAPGVRIQPGDRVIFDNPAID